MKRFWADSHRKGASWQPWQWREAHALGDDSRPVSDKLADNTARFRYMCRLHM